MPHTDNDAFSFEGGSSDDGRFYSFPPPLSSSSTDIHRPSLSTASSSVPAIIMGQRAIIPMQNLTSDYIQAFRGRTRLSHRISSLFSSAFSSTETPDVTPIRTQLTIIFKKYTSMKTAAEIHIHTMLGALLNTVPMFTEQVLMTQLLDKLWQMPTPVSIQLLKNVMDLNADSGLNFETYFTYLNYFTEYWHEIRYIAMVQDEYEKKNGTMLSKAVHDMFSIQQIASYIRENSLSYTFSAYHAVDSELKEEAYKQREMKDHHAIIIKIHQCDALLQEERDKDIPALITSPSVFIYDIQRLPFAVLEPHLPIVFTLFKRMLPYFSRTAFEQFAKFYHSTISALAETRSSIHMFDVNACNTPMFKELAQRQAQLLKLAHAFESESWLLFAMNHCQDGTVLESLVSPVSLQELVQATTAALASNQPILAQLIVKERYERYQRSQGYSLRPGSLLPSFVQTPTREELPYVCDLTFRHLTDPVTTPHGGKYEKSEIEALIAKRLQQGEPLVDPLTGNPRTREELLLPIPALNAALAAQREAEKAAGATSTESISRGTESPTSPVSIRLSTSPKATTFGASTSQPHPSTSEVPVTEPVFAPIPTGHNALS